MSKQAVKRYLYKAAALVATCLPLTSLQAQISAHADNILANRSLDPTRIASGRMPLTASSRVRSTSCLADAATSGAACGYVDVPLDRSNSSRGSIAIYFELYHFTSGQAVSAILANGGGPGMGTTNLRQRYLGTFHNNFDTHDLLLIDDRGRGLSGAILCDGLQQNGIVPQDQATAACAAQLGAAASLYGTGDIAQDTEEVRAALGYDKVDYYAASYGVTDVTAYATRFGSHLRSLVLDAPWGTPGLNPIVDSQYRAAYETVMVQLSCRRSPTCAPDHPNAAAEFNALVRSVAASPVVGDSHDANGNPVHVQIDETYLLVKIIDQLRTFSFNTGEILAAARSLSEGDVTPLLRLGAEVPPFEPDYPTIQSWGSLKATGCADALVPWDWKAPVANRTHRYNNLVAALPASLFSPFSKAVVTGADFNFFGPPCFNWQIPSPSSPVAPANAVYPAVPTLLLSGDLDSRVPLVEVVQVAALFPNSKLVRIAGAGHVTIGSTCAATLASQFIETLQVGDTGCARQPETISPAVGRFPTLAQFARPAIADSTGNNQASPRELQVVTAAVAAMTDSAERSLLGSSGTGVGLRGGTFSVNRGDPWIITLSNCAFANDVLVSGTVTWNLASKELTANLTVSGSGTGGGSLQVLGTPGAPGPVGNFRVTGVLGGKQVAALVPEA